MKTLEILRAARAKIERPECWLRGRYAADARGISCEPNSPKACRFCSEGALRSCGMGWSFAYDVLRKSADPFTNLPNWNDDPARTHAEVLAAFDRAIASLS